MAGRLGASVTGQARAQVVVVGAGWGGLGAVRALAAEKAADIVLVEPNDRHVVPDERALCRHGRQAGGAAARL